MNTFLSNIDTQAVRITVGAVTLLVVAIVAMIGAESYGKFNRFLFLGQIVTIWLTFGCMLFRKAPYVRSLSLPLLLIPRSSVTAVFSQGSPSPPSKRTSFRRR